MEVTNYYEAQTVGDFAIMKFRNSPQERPQHLNFVTKISIIQRFLLGYSKKIIIFESIQNFWV